MQGFIHSRAACTYCLHDTRDFWNERSLTNLLVSGINSPSNKLFHHDTFRKYCCLSNVGKPLTYQSVVFVRNALVFSKLHVRTFKPCDHTPRDLSLFNVALRISGEGGWFVFGWSRPVVVSITNSCLSASKMIFSNVDAGKLISLY